MDLENVLKKYSASRLVIGKNSISYLDSKKKFLVLKNGESKQFESFEGAYNHLIKEN